MPRLEGRRSNSAIYILLVIVALLAVLLVLEYAGITNLVANI